VDKELEAYARLGIMLPCRREDLLGVCSIGVQAQAGGLRLTIDGSPLNDQMAPPEKFAYEDISHLATHLAAGQYMAKADVRRLYLNVPIADSVSRWVGFHWKGRFWRFVALPLGLAHAPRLATLVMRPIVAFLRRLDVQLSQYLDDGLVAADSAPHAAAAFGMYKQVLARVGLVLHPRKCTTTPTQDIEFLGFRVRTTPSPTIAITGGKRAAYVQQARRLMADHHNKRKVPVKKLSRFVGSIVSTMRAFLPSLALCATRTRLLRGL
jgi:hypothetical protein